MKMKAYMEGCWYSSSRSARAYLGELWDEKITVAVTPTQMMAVAAMFCFVSVSP